MNPCRIINKQQSQLCCWEDGGGGGCQASLRNCKNFVFITAKIMASLEFNI